MYTNAYFCAAFCFSASHSNCLALLRGVPLSLPPAPAAGAGLALEPIADREDLPPDTAEPVPPAFSFDTAELVECESKGDAGLARPELPDGLRLCPPPLPVALPVASGFGRNL